MKIRHKRKKHIISVIVILLFAGVGSYFLFAAHASPLGRAAYIPKPRLRFVSIGRSDSQFTEADYQTIVNRYGWVIINKQHDNDNINGWYDAAKELKKRNPDITVSTYWESKFWFNRQALTWKEPDHDPNFNSAWLLRDNSSNLISGPSSATNPSYYYDLSNPAFRNWALAQLQHRMSKAPWDGIQFDSAYLLSEPDPYGMQWNTLLGTARVQAYNNGLMDLYKRAKAMFPAKIITYNGITPFNNAYRGLDKISYLDGATDETFCIDFFGNINSSDSNIEADIQLMQHYTNKKLLFHTNYNTSELGANYGPAIGRFCHAAFMMGWVPGADFHKFAMANNTYSIAALNYELPEMTLQVGRPVSLAQKSTTANGGILYQREFTHGRIYVNLSKTAAVGLALPSKLIQYEDGKELKTYNSGAGFILAPQTAAYFINYDYIHPNSTAALNSPSDDDSDTSPALSTNSSSSSPTTTPSASSTIAQPVSKVLGLTSPLPCDQASKITVKVDGRSLETTTSCNLGQVDTSTLPNGLHQITVEATGKDGKITTSSHLIYINNRLSPYERLRNFLFKPWGGRPARQLNSLFAFVVIIFLQLIAALSALAYYRFRRHRAHKGPA